MGTATRRKPTAEQTAAAAERRERIRKLAKSVSAMSQQEREAMIARFGAIVTIEGRRLSPFNSCLVIRQREGVSVVGGFQQWKRAGRKVRKGEHGVAIWIPTGRETEPDEDDDDQRQRFVLGTVFDVTQTDAAASCEECDCGDDTNAASDYADCECSCHD